jgi:hypothetical protein
MNIVLQKFLSPLALHVFSHMELKNEYIYICIYIGYTYSIPWVWNNYSIREPSRRTDHHRFFVVFFQPVSILFPQSINFRNVVVKKTSVLLVEIVGPRPPSVPFRSVPFQLRRLRRRRPRGLMHRRQSSLVALPTPVPGRCNGLSMLHPRPRCRPLMGTDLGRFGAAASPSLHAVCGRSFSGVGPCYPVVFHHLIGLHERSSSLVPSAWSHP